MLKETTTASPGSLTDTALMVIDMAATGLRILLAIDGSTSAGLAVDLAAGISWPPETRIVVAQAVETGAGLPGGAFPAPVGLQLDHLETEMRGAAKRIVDEAQRRLDRPGVHAKAMVLCGRPATAIVGEARAMQADLIIVGSRGHGTIESMLLGSVSAEVVDHAPAPVLVARRGSVDRIVLAWDGSSGSATAADLLATWPMFRDSAVRVVTVDDVDVAWWTGFPGPGAAEFSSMYLEAATTTRAARAELARHKSHELEEAGLTSSADHREGDAAVGILAAAADFNADLIVMGTHGRTGLTRLMLGSVARNVLHHASCSVLIVRQGSQKRC